MFFTLPLTGLFYILINALALIPWKKALLPNSPVGVHPIYGNFHLRWWLFSLFWTSNGPFTHTIVGTSLYNVYLRALGAKIGQNVTILTTNLDLLDLIEIQDNTFIANYVVIDPYDLKDWKMTVQRYSLVKWCSSVNILGWSLDQIALLVRGVSSLEGLK